MTHTQMDHRLDALERFAEQHTITVADVVTIVDCYLSACAAHVDEDTMQKITAAGDDAFRHTIGRTFEWTWLNPPSEEEPASGTTASTNQACGSWLAADSLCSPKRFKYRGCALAKLVLARYTRQR